MSALRIQALRLLYRVAYRLLQVRALFVRHPGPGVKCVLTHERSVLLVRHSYGSREVWQLPGGGAHRGETPRQAATREMREELAVGVSEQSWRELVTVDLRLERVPVHLTCLHAELADAVVRPDPVEIAEVRWFPMGELPFRRGAEVKRLVELLVKEPEQGSAQRWEA
ncbi:MAG TPA: NUDIX domain-containing protein [Solirubrobacteraceae bacterium]|nr:NUDIX domain-containing protein [Solirubrobacteraceae bacterium]